MYKLIAKKNLSQKFNDWYTKRVISQLNRGRFPSNENFVAESIVKTRNMKEFDKVGNNEGITSPTDFAEYVKIPL